MSGEDKDKEFKPTTFFGFFKNLLSSPNSIEDLNERSLRTRANIVYWLSSLTGSPLVDSLENISSNYDFYSGKFYFS